MRFDRLELGKTHRDYVSTWELQREIHAAVVAGTRPNTVLLVEHEPVLTAGRRTNRAERPADGTPVVDVDRGGKITWHGPGQLVIYPIVRLAEPIDVLAYVRALEESVMRLLREFGVDTIRVDGRSGVWVPRTAEEPERKIAAIGVRVAKGVTMHGVAINADPDLSSFSTFIPCGIADAGVTSIRAETGVHVSPIEIADRAEYHLSEVIAPLLAAPENAPAAERRQDHVGAPTSNVVPKVASA